jgi:adenylosuccinate lyase
MCGFNAVEMLKKRREASADKTKTVMERTTAIREIDEERWKHFGSTGCDCWDVARGAA